MNNIERLISVVIPCYNTGDYVAEAIASVLNQTFIDAIVEVIVIDNGSTDNSAVKIQEMALASSLVQYIYQENTGVSGARNRGILTAKGSYIAFLDADDLWLPEKIQLQYESILKYPDTGLFYSDLIKFDPLTNLRTRVAAIAYQSNETKLLYKFVAQGAPVIPSTALVKKACFEKVGLFDLELRAGGEDIDMWLRIARYYPFQHVAGYLIQKREVKSSLGADTSRNAVGYHKALDNIQNLEPSVAPFRRKREALIHYKVGLYFYKQGNHAQAYQEVKKSFKKDTMLMKAYALWAAILVRKTFGLKILKTES